MAFDTDDPRLARVLRRIGTTLCRRYRISHVIGIGGMSAVYGGLHRNGLEVAIKVLHEGLPSRRDLERLRREARLANKIHHRGVVRFIDDDVAEDGAFFLVMDLLKGRTVREWAARHGGKLPLRQVAFIAHALLDVLKATHAQGIAHRDIKPENLFITADGELRVLDFGIACLFENTGVPSVTHSGRTTGTPAFMAPEQALGHIEEIDGRTDLWAVGATMFTLLSGRFVHEAPSASEVLIRAGTESAPSIREVAPELPDPVCDVIDRALAFEKDKRWPSADAMDAALARTCEALFDGSPIAFECPLPAPEVASDIRDATTQGSPLKRDMTCETESTSKGSWGQDTRIAAIAMDHRPRWKNTLARWTGGAVMALALGGIIGIALSRRATAATELVAASHKAWRDGNIESARARAEEAIRENGSFAEAHLARVRVCNIWPSGADRTHFLEAQEGRDDLTASERRYLDALAPAMTVPPNFLLSAERLEALHRADRTDLEVRVALAISWMRIRRVDDAIDLLHPLSETPDARGIVLALLGLARGMRDDIDGSRATYQRCAANYPAASFCTLPLAQLDLLEGRCADGERTVRQHLEAHPRDPSARLWLAYALAARGAGAGEIHAALQRWADLLDGPGSTLHHLRADFKLALYLGRLGDALGIHEHLEREIGKLDSDEERFAHAFDGMLLKAELGLASEARDEASRYSDARHGLRRHPYREDEVTYIQAYATRLGLLPWERWVQLRDDRLASRRDRDHLADGPQRNWLDYFAIPAHTPSGAREALDALPTYLPLLPRTDRWYQHDAAIGSVFAMTGKTQEATAHFERGVAGCTHLDGPIQYAHMLLSYGEMLQTQGNDARACAMYRRVLERFPESSKSRSAIAATERQTVACHP